MIFNIEIADTEIMEKVRDLQDLREVLIEIGEAMGVVVGQRVVAVVQPVAGAEPTLDDLVAHARHHLAGYKLPRDLVVVPTVERSPAGKADYRWAKTVATARSA